MRFLKFSYTHPKFRFSGSKRQTVDRTPKAKALLILALLLFLLSDFFFFLFFPSPWGDICYFIISLLIFPCRFILASLLLSPLDWGMKRYRVSQAKKHLSKFPNLTIIGITGSYGKTSTKEYLKTLLQEKFNVIATPGTHNTPLGISEFVLKNLNEQTEIMIIEMGAYLPGDIRELCKITPPKIALLTGITEQHLERFKTVDTIIKTKFEIASHLPADGLLVVDGENSYIQKGLHTLPSSFSTTIEKIGSLTVSYLPELAGISFSFRGKNYQTKLLGRHNAKNLALAISVAENLGMSEEEIQLQMKKIEFVPHRLQLIKNEKTGVYVLDDSFNGNKEGVLSTIDLLKHTTLPGKKIYLTPGLVELGSESETIHVDLGKFLAPTIDLALLIETPATKALQNGLLAGGFDQNKIVLYQTALQAHESLGSFLQKGDLIVFQNDLTDNYL